MGESPKEIVNKTLRMRMWSSWFRFNLEKMDRNSDEYNKAYELLMQNYDDPDEIISQMIEFFPGVPPPEKVNSSKPDTSLSLGWKRRAWLKENGGIQPTIKRLVDEAMKEEQK